VVPFIVNFADGVSAIIRVYETDLRSGDHVVRIIAREQQEDGRLRKGKIVGISRFKSREQAAPA
jgi:hypothetical protein